MPELQTNDGKGFVVSGMRNRFLFPMRKIIQKTGSGRILSVPEL
jgi:hypothetical protein